MITTCAYVRVSRVNTIKRVRRMTVARDSGKRNVDIYKSIKYCHNYRGSDGVMCICTFLYFLQRASKVV